MIRGKKDTLIDMNKQDLILKNYADRLCQEGRKMFKYGEEDHDWELKRTGLKTLAEGLIQQNPLRDRPENPRSHIRGKRSVEVR